LVTTASGTHAFTRSYVQTSNIQGGTLSGEAEEKNTRKCSDIIFFGSRFLSIRHQHIRSMGKHALELVTEIGRRTVELCDTQSTIHHVRYAAAAAGPSVWNALYPNMKSCDSNTLPSNLISKLSYSLVKAFLGILVRVAILSVRLRFDIIRVDIVR